MEPSRSGTESRDLSREVCDTLHLAELERLQLSCELHDGFLQLLVGLRMQIEALRRRLHAGSSEGVSSFVSDLVQVERSLISAIDHGRKWIGELRGNVDLKTASLVGILGHAVHEARSQWPALQILADLDPAIDRPPLQEPVKNAVLRIAQESIRNACRHSGANEVVLSASYDPEYRQWTMEVQDNGRGFDPHQLPSDHYGVLGMRTRAELIGAALTIESQKGKGTKVLLKLDLPAT